MQCIHTVWCCKNSSTLSVFLRTVCLTEDYVFPTDEIMQQEIRPLLAVDIIEQLHRQFALLSGQWHDIFHFPTVLSDYPNVRTPKIVLLKMTFCILCWAKCHHVLFVDNIILMRNQQQLFTSNISTIFSCPFQWWPQRIIWQLHFLTSFSNICKHEKKVWLLCVWYHVPGGRGKDGAPIITFPEYSGFSDVPEEDFHNVITYLTSIPRYTHTHVHKYTA